MLSDSSRSFLEKNGIVSASMPLLGDASSRRYYRAVDRDRSLLLVVTQDHASEIRKFLEIGDLLRKHGIRVPRVFDVDEENGLLLIEDLGDGTLSSLLDRGADPVPLYEAAVDTLIEVQKIKTAVGLPAWNYDTMPVAVAQTFIEWWWPETFGAQAAKEISEEFTHSVSKMLKPFPGSVFVHRDYMAPNLILCPSEGKSSIAIIDFQDGSIGHAAYDLVSLLQDSRRDFSAEFEQRMMARYLAIHCDLDADNFRAAYAAHAAHRALRASALWIRLARRDGKMQYLAHSSRTWRQLAVALEHEATRPLAEFLNSYVPSSARMSVLAA